MYPFVQTAWLSLFKWDGIGPKEWVGLDNYRTIWDDPMVRQAFEHSFVLIVVFFSALPIAIASGVCDQHAGPRPRRRRAAHHDLPAADHLHRGHRRDLSWILAPDGPLNQGLRKVGLGFLQHNWIGSFTWTLPSVGLIGTWAAIGLCVALFVAGIQKIPRSLYDAASVDGAGRIREFFAVTLPSLRGELAVAVTLTVVGALRAFDVIFVMTRGGPGTSTIVPGILVYNHAFADGRVGEACATGVMLAATIFVLALVINWVADRGRA